MFDVTTSGSVPSRLVTVTGANGSSTDTYKMDQWGRVQDSPLVTLSYDALDEVVGVNEKTGLGLANTIQYDGLGNRVLTSYGPSANGGSLVSLLPWYEEKADATGREGHCRLVDSDHGRTIGELVKSDNSTSRTANFYLMNNVGTAVGGFSSDGSQVTAPQTDPFGNPVADSQLPFLTPEASQTDGLSRAGFGGHDSDNRWNLVDMVSRFYSPRLGRFTSPDTALFDVPDRRKHNAFTYVRNAPNYFIDPDGPLSCRDRHLQILTVASL